MKKFSRWIAYLLVSVLLVCSFSGCGMLDDEPSDSGDYGFSSNTDDSSEKGLLDDLFDVLLEDDTTTPSYSDDDYDQFSQGSSSSDDDFLDSLFDAFFGSSSSDYGWGDSSYSGGSDNYIGGNTGEKFDYADISDIGSGSGKATIMVYVIGSNLESDSGCATMDIQEMCKANIGSNVNLIIEAGGAKRWQNSVMTSGKVGRFQVVGDGIRVLEDRGKKSMVEPSEVLDFIKYSVKNFPADRYGFIFWNHGGGTMAGFGMDDLANGDLSLDEISDAFDKSGVKFDFVGFDACLMGTIETAYALSDNASYLIAAEEEEPGYGWYYTSWLKALSQNPSVDMEKLGSIIVDDFVAANGSDDVTLSLIDLSKISNVYKKLSNLCSQGNAALYAGNYKEIAKVRKNTKCYGEGNYDQIDIIDFCERCGLDGAEDLIASVKDCVVYHKTNISRTNGLAMYFPYDYPSYYKQMKTMMKSFGMNDDKVSGFFNNFLSARSGGSCSRAMTPMAVKTGYEDDTPEEDFTTEEWYNQEVAEDNEVVEFELNEDGLLPLTEEGDGYVYEISEDQVDAIAMIDIGLFALTEDGYIDYGNDNSYGLDDYGNLIIDSDFTWVAINGIPVPFTIVEEGETSDGGSYCYGITDAILTSARTGEEREIEILIYWDDKHEGPYVKGYRNATDGEGPSQAERNVTNFIKGDVIQFICDFYTLDGDYDDTYLYEDPIVVNSPLVVSYEEIGYDEVDVYGHILDIYGNDYYTETVTVPAPF
ncbi:MAG: hypothetical protein IKW90_04485 [Lachnospiraceae bacterium]|nr:hypothetical protein [Lachnospiraceae bacterium]